MGDQFFSTIHQQFSQCLFFVHTQHSRASLAEQLLAASASQLQLDPFPQHVRDLLRATEREIRREKPPKIKDHQMARSTMLNIQDQHRPVKARKLDPAQQAARLERAENKEFEQGHDRAPPAAEDKVDKKFWQGKGGSADHE